MRVSTPIEFLEDCDPDAEVMVATQPNYPMQLSIGDHMEFEDNDGNITVYLAERKQEYLQSGVRDQLNW